MPSAILLDLPASFASAKALSALQPVAEQSILERLTRRIRSHAAWKDAAIVYLCGNETTRGRVASLAQTLEALCHAGSLQNASIRSIEFAKAHSTLDPLVLVSADSLLLDLDATFRLAERHRTHGAHLTFAEDVPPGLLPEWVARRDALLRLGELGIPEQRHVDLASFVEQANRLFRGDKRRSFQVAKASPGDLALNSLTQYPADVRVDTAAARRAAETIIHTFAHGAPDWALYKEERVKEESKLPAFATPTTAGGAPRVLYVNGQAGFSGAEGCLAATAAAIGKSAFEAIALVGYEGVLADRLRSAGVPLEVAHDDLTTLTPAMIRYCETFLKHANVRLVHANAGSGVPILLAASRLKIPTVYHVRSLVKLKPPSEMLFADRLIAVSEESAEDLRRLTIASERVALIPDGVDTAALQAQRLSREQARQTLGIAPDAAVLVMAARLSPQKRQHFLLEAAAIAAKRLPSLLVLFAGEASPGGRDYPGRLMRMTKELRLDRHVRWLGFVENMPAAYSAGDAAILCSEDETFGHTILEAMALGLPTLLPERGVHRRFFEADVHTKLFDAHDPEKAAQEIVNLLTHPDQQDRLRRNAESALAPFAIDRHALRMQELYKSLGV